MSPAQRRVDALCLRVRAQMEAHDSEGYFTTHPDFVGLVFDACCAAVVYGSAFLHANVNRPYLFAVSTSLQLGQMPELGAEDILIREGADRWESKYGLRLRVKKAREE